MATIVSFSRTPEQFLKYGERGLTKQITAGRMTEEDAALIRQFVDAMRVQNGAGEARAYKMTNSLSNVCRFIKTPLMENTIGDINSAVLKIKNGRKIKNCLVMAPLPENLKPDADTEVFEFTRDGQQWYHVCKTTGPLSQDTKRDYITFLKRFYIWCVEEG